MTRRVVVTGLGAVSALGPGVDALWRGCREARNTAVAIPEHWSLYTRLRSPAWSPLPAIDFAAHGFTRAELRQRDQLSLMALMAADEALRGAGVVERDHDARANTFRLRNLNADRCGVYLGTGIGGAAGLMDNYVFHLLDRGRARLQGDDDACLEELRTNLGQRRRVNPFIVSTAMPNAPAAAVGIKFGLTGPYQTYAHACASGTAAIGHAYGAVSRGDLDFVVTGGAEFMGDRAGGIFMSFDVAGTLTHYQGSPGQASRPFDEERAGFLFSEGGAAVMVLESAEHAQARGARALASVAGYAETSDAHSMVSNAAGGEQIERMIRGALAEASISPEEIDHINSHGTGTQVNDHTEALVIERLFGDRPSITASKSILGHTIGASGAFEALLTVLSLQEQVVHPCRNLERPIRPLNFVRQLTHQRLDYALTHSFGFGGHNAGLVLRRA